MRHDGTIVNKVQCCIFLSPVPRNPLHRRLSNTHEPMLPRVQEPAKEPHGVRRSSFSSARAILSFSFFFFFSRIERPILISIMTRNGCWRECSSLSIAPVPVVYLSGTRTAPFHPSEKHRETETAASRLFFYIAYPLFFSFPSTPTQCPFLFSNPLFLLEFLCLTRRLLRIMLLITFLCVVIQRSWVMCSCVQLFLFYFCRSGYESSMTTGLRTLSSTLPWTTCRRASSFTYSFSVSAADIA